MFLKNYLELFHRDKKVMTLEQFKRALREDTACWGFISTMNTTIGSYLSSPSPDQFRILNTWFNFFRRLNVPGLNLEHQMEEEYVAFEDGIIEEQDENLIVEMESIFYDWFRDFTLESFTPKHGPGSVSGTSGRLPLVFKYTLMKRDVLLDYIKKDIGQLHEWSPLPFEFGECRTSELVCVPKSIITNRTISREPASLMYFQQAYASCIVRHVHSHPYLRRIIDFSNQQLSQDMAREGSIRGKFATIDLSAASDSVSFDLVKRLLKRLPLLRRGVIATRSTHTILPSGRVLKLKKFAPMGSALCFPIETIIFALCCEVARRRCGIGTYRVYGDDIIIDSRIVDTLSGILNTLRFKVNVTKSFRNVLPRGNFREACGGEYLDGINVAPFRLPRKFKGENRLTNCHPDSIASYISLANTAFDAYLLHTRYLILKDLESAYVGFQSLPFSDDGKKGIKTFSYCCTNWRLKRRFDGLTNRKSCTFQMQYFENGSTILGNCEACSKFAKNTGVELSCTDSMSYHVEKVRLFEWLKQRSRQTVTVCQSSTIESITELENSAIGICPQRAVMRVRWR